MCLSFRDRSGKGFQKFNKYQIWHSMRFWLVYRDSYIGLWQSPISLDSLSSPIFRFFGAPLNFLHLPQVPLQGICFFSGSVSYIDLYIVHTSNRKKTQEKFPQKKTIISSPWSQPLIPIPNPFFLLAPKKKSSPSKAGQNATSIIPPRCRNWSHHLLEPPPSSRWGKIFHGKNFRQRKKMIRCAKSSDRKTRRDPSNTSGCLQIYVSIKSLPHTLT